MPESKPNADRWAVSPPTDSNLRWRIAASFLTPVLMGIVAIGCLMAGNGRESLLVLAIGAQFVFCAVLRIGSYRSELTRRGRGHLPGLPRFDWLQPSHGAERSWLSREALILAGVPYICMLVVASLLALGGDRSIGIVLAAVATTMLVFNLQLIYMRRMTDPVPGPKNRD